MDTPFPAYKGNEKFTFVCYSHADAEAVYPDIGWLDECGLNLWYDEGISGGSLWRAEIGQSIEHADKVLFFISNSSLESDHCSREINYALDQGIDVVPVFLEDIELTTDLRVGLARVQALKRFVLPAGDYRMKLRAALVHHTPAMYTGASKRRRSKALPLTVAGLALALVALVIYIANFLPASQSRSVGVNPASLAVLTFSGASNLQDQSYIAAGLSEELRTHLKRVAGLRLVSNDSSSQFDGQNDPAARAVGEQLAVAYYAGGVVQRRENEIVVHAKLVDTANAEVVLSRSLAFVLDAAVDIPRTLAMDIAMAILPQQAGEIGAALGNPRLIKPGAYGPYLHALDLRRQPPSPAVLENAESKLQETLAVDDSFAQAHAALCDTYLAMVTMANTEDTGVRFDNAANACGRALALDNTLWEVRAALGRMYIMTGDYQRAVDELRLADALSTNNSDVQLALGKALAAAGETAAAEQAFKRGIELDPGFWGGHADLGDFLYERARYPEALAAFRRVTDLRPGSGYALVSLGAALFSLDQRDEAEAAWRQAMATNPDSTSRAYWQAAHWMGFHRRFQGCFQSMAYWQREAARSSPEFHAIWGELGDACHLQRSNPQLTARIFQHAMDLANADLNLNPNDWAALGRSAVYSARLGRPAAGEINIQHMLNVEAQSGDAYELAAQFAAAAGDEEALNRYKRAAAENGYPVILLMRDPAFGSPQTCPVTKPSETIDCSRLTEDMLGIGTER